MGLPDPSTRQPELGRLAFPGYAIGILFAALPFADRVLLVWPFRPGEPRWRFGAVGIMTQALLPIALGLFIVCSVAVLLGHRRLLRALAVASGAFALLLIAVTVLYALDTIQLRVSVKPAALTAFDVSATVAGVKLLLIAAVSGGMARVGWTVAARWKRMPRRAAEDVRQGMVFGRRTERPATTTSTASSR